VSSPWIELSMLSPKLLRETLETVNIAYWERERTSTTTATTVRSFVSFSSCFIAPSCTTNAVSSANDSIGLTARS